MIVIIIWLFWVFVAVHGLPLVVEGGGYFLVVRGVLTAVASLSVKNGL